MPLWLVLHLTESQHGSQGYPDQGRRVLSGHYYPQHGSEQNTHQRQLRAAQSHTMHHREASMRLLTASL